MSEIMGKLIYENAGIPKLIILQSIKAVRLVTCCNKITNYTKLFTK